MHRASKQSAAQGCMQDPPKKWGENPSVFPPPQLHDLNIRPCDCKGDFFCSRERCCSLCLRAPVLGWAGCGDPTEKGPSSHRHPRTTAPPAGADGSASGLRTPPARWTQRTPPPPQSGSQADSWFLRQLPKIAGWPHHHKLVPQRLLQPSCPPPALPTVTPPSRSPSLVLGPQRGPQRVPSAGALTHRPHITPQRVAGSSLSRWARLSVPRLCRCPSLWQGGTGENRSWRGDDPSWGLITRTG